MNLQPGRTMRQVLPALLLGLPLVLVGGACGSSNEGSGGPAADAVVEHSVHDVKCGCSVTEIGHCGNYIDIDGELFEINGTEGEGAKLGPMEWCGVDGAKAEVEGEVKDGKFIAKYIKTIQP